MTYDPDKVWEKRADEGYESFTRHPWLVSAKWTAIFIGVIVAISLVLNAFGVANIFWQAQQAKITAPARVTKATFDTNNILHNISYFHDQCNTVLADEQNVVNATATLKTDQATLASTSDPIAQQQAGSAVTQDESTLIGTKDQLSNDVRDYDSKSATQTANPFKANNLPYRLSINPATGELAGTVNCH